MPAGSGPVTEVGGNLRCETGSAYWIVPVLTSAPDSVADDRFQPVPGRRL